MNKKLFLSMFAAAGMLLATSCSKETLNTTQSGSEAQVTFALGLQGGIGTKTRAISDGTGADKLVYAVFDGNGSRITTIEKKELTNVTFPANVTLTLAKGQTYKVAFWAQDADCGAYTLDDNMNVTVSYDNATNNDESRDAFFKTETFTVTGSTSIDVELKRPFAQINVGVTEDDWNAAVASGITIEQSSVTIKKAATSIDLLTGEVGGSTDVSYALAGIPTEDLAADKNGDGVDETYKYLSMSYILVADGSADGAGKATLDGLEFTFKPSSGNDIVLKDGLASVPVQRNYRTNILGQLLTGNIDFNISIAPIYDGDYAYPSGSAQELAMAAANGGTVTLRENVTLTEPLVVAEGKTVVVNLGGYEVKNDGDIWNEDENDWSLFSVRGGKLILTGEGTVKAKENDCFAVDVQDGGEVVIENGTYIGNIDAVYVHTGKAVIKGGAFSIQQTSGTANKEYGYVINCKNENYLNGSASVEITGGEFENFDPASPLSDDAETYVPEGYSSVKVSEDPLTYQVVENATSADGAKTSLAKNNGVVVVASDMTADSWSAGKNSLLVLKDNAVLSGAETATHTIISAQGLLTIEGDGTIESPGKDADKGAIEVTSNGSVVINGNVTVKNKGGNKAGTVDAPIMFLGGGGSSTKTVTINGGYFYAYNDAEGEENPCILLRGSRYNGKSILNINGGVFDSETENNSYLINVQDSGVAGTWNKINITGGIFVGFDPAKGDSGTDITTFVAEGYESVEITYEGKTAYQVKKIQ